MHFLRSKLFAFSVLAALAAAGYYIISADAVQGQGELAQAPLNSTAQVAPAFIMAVDDSNSMRWQAMFPGANGGACWQTSMVAGVTAGSFFNNDGSLRTTGNTCTYYNVMVNPANAVNSNSWYTIPPLDQFGFARASEFNPAYFDPGVRYLPWLAADGTPYRSDVNTAGNASLTATWHDPLRSADRTGLPTLAGRPDAGTINLASLSNNTGNDDRVMLWQGMTLPPGTQYKTNANAAAWTTAGPNGFRANNNTLLWIRYWPATFYQRWRSDSDPRPSLEGNAAAYAGVDRVRVANACGQNCDMWRYTIRSTDTAALQNFANWYAYYGNRTRAMIAGVTHSMATVNNMRVGYFTINNRINVTMWDMGSSIDKGRLYREVLRLDPISGTPNLAAVNHLGQQFMRTGTGAPIVNMCQKNAGMLFTDGYSNDTFTQASPTDASVRGIPFDPTPANSMAAIASRYYATNLNAGFPAGKVRVPSECDTLDPTSITWKRLDCKTNLHMNFYGITLGGRGNLFNPGANPAQDPYVDASINGNWPGHQADQPSTIDDIWHATINTRGKYINASTPVQIISAMREILGLVGDGGVPSGSIGLTGARVGTGSMTVTPSYSIANSGTDWYGELVARNVTVGSGVGELQYATRWTASQALPAPNDRTIRYGTATGSGSFDASNVSVTSLCDNPRPNMSRCTPSEVLGLGVTLADAVAYLRGNRSLEGTRLRQRTTVLGDIVNSNVMVSSPATDDYGYRSMVDAAGDYDPYGYAGYRASKAARASTVYVGANDGMLHAFDGATGVEKFAYIPQAVLGHMGNLLFPYVAASGADQKFQHRYYVDGPVVVGDAAFGTAASPDWRTVLVGATGAGGRSVFALDVSDQSLGAGDRLWELNDQHSNTLIAKNIGHALGKPVIVPVRDGGGKVAWKAIFGNGYGSQNGNAVLFVVDIGSGQATLIPAIESGAPAGANGLGNVIAIDRLAGASSGRDGYADTVYAVDQKGAVWRFDLGATTLATGTAQLAAVTTPVFVATDASSNRQPITGGIEVSAAPGGNVMLYFGTGSFSFVGDAADTGRQSFYAVLDAGRTVTGKRSELLVQSVTNSAGSSRTVSSLPMPAGKYGWLLDLSPNGERFVGYPRLENGIVFFTTFEPASTNTCDSSGSNWLYGLFALNGGAALSGAHVDSISGDGHAAGTGGVNTNTSGLSRELGFLVPPGPEALSATATAAELNAALAARCTMAILGPGGTTVYMKRPCGRQSWRQLQ